MIVVSTDKGDFSFQSADDVLKFVQTAALENSEIWISGKQPYPCMTVCINGEYAVVSLNSAFSCVREFCVAYERPSCIQWQEL